MVAATAQMLDPIRSPSRSPRAGPRGSSLPISAPTVIAVEGTALVLTVVQSLLVRILDQLPSRQAHPARGELIAGEAVVSLGNELTYVARSIAIPLGFRDINL